MVSDEILRSCLALYRHSEPWRRIFYTLLSSSSFATLKDDTYGVGRKRNHKYPSFMTALFYLHCSTKSYKNQDFREEFFVFK